MKIKHYLIASETNDYRPWITTSSALVYFTVLVWGLKLVLPASLTMAEGFLNPSDIMNRINLERTNRAIPTLTTDSKLVVAAQGKADDMLKRSYFSHIDPDGNYVWPKIEAAGYKPFLSLGENLAMDFTSADELVSAWMNSPTHRANMLNDKFKDQGLAQTSGLYESNHNTTVVVSLFGVYAKAGSKLSGTQSIKQTNSNPSGTALAIGNDASVNLTQVSGLTIVELGVTITGNPTLATAKLLTQSITLLSQGNNKYTGKFTFNPSDVLNGKDITIEARDAKNVKATSTVTLGDIQTVPAEAAPGGEPPTGKIMVSNEAQMIKVLRIIFAILSIVYLGFLVTDWVILRRAHIQRPGMLHSPQIVVFLIVAFVNIFAKF